MYNQPPKYVMVTPNLRSNDNSNSTARALNIAAIACMCLARFVPAMGSFLLLFDEYSSGSGFNLYGLNMVLVLASLILLIIARVKFPGDSVSKGLLIGFVVRTVFAIMLTIMILVLGIWFVSLYALSDIADIIWELIELFE